MLYDPKAPRRAVILSLNSQLVERACAAKLNLSAVAEAAIARALAEAARRRFDQEIARGVAEHERFLATYSSFAEAVRAMDADVEP